MTLGRSALGKGLSALIPAPRYANTRDDYFLCPLEDIIADPAQPRQYFDDDKLDELVLSIKEKGILQPLVVRRIENPPPASPKFIVIAGERRLRAARKAGLTEVPVLVKEVASNEALELALIENLQREDLNAIEEAQAFSRLLDMESYTQDVLARRLGKSRSTITNSLRLLKLNEEHQQLVADGRLSPGHARCILALEDEDEREELVALIIEKEISVREAEAWVQKKREQQTPENAKTPTRQTPLMPYFHAMADDLSKHLATKVEIKSSGRKGRISINFESLEELRRLKNVLGLSDQGE